MAHYNRIKTQKIAPVGTILPWTGGSTVGDSADDIPRGWLICNAGQKGLNAADYPILASIIGNEYGPFPDATIGQQTGINFGIVNAFPYNKDIASGHVDTFDLPNLNQVALVDLEMGLVDTDSSNGDSDITVVGPYMSRNGSTGTQAKTLVKSDIDLSFNVEPSNNLAGRVTGIVMDPPIYFTSAYVIPRKLGIDHTPAHTHRPASDSEFDQFFFANPTGNKLLEWQPGKGLQDASNVSSVTAIGWKGNTSQAHTFRPGLYDVTWYDQNDGGISMVDGGTQKNVAATAGAVPVGPTAGRTIPITAQIENEYQDMNAAIPGLPPAPAHTGAFPPAGRYQGARNFYASTDIPVAHRGAGMPNSYVEDEPVNAEGKQVPNPNVTNTYTTCLNHEAERFADAGLRSHKHDSMEISMTKGSLGIPTTLLVNNVSTGTTVPVDIDTALSVNVNANTPSQTMIYIMRAF